MKNITVIIDRVSGSNIPTAKAEIEEVLEALKPLRERGLRVPAARMGYNDQHPGGGRACADR